MLGKKLTRSIRLYLIGTAILLAGLLGAGSIYLTATDDQGDALGYEFIDGQAYAINASDSKMYRRELERFGGKAAIFADDLNRWFSSLWHGKRLATTVAALATLLALFFFRAGMNCKEGPNNEHRS
ncbi:MAG: hypothetical protein WCK63_01990 [Betaproteobacteria bacterium]